MPLPLIKLDQVIYRLERFKPWNLKNIRIFRSIEMPGRESATISTLDDHLDNPPGIIAFPGVRPIQNRALGNNKPCGYCDINCRDALACAAVRDPVFSNSIAFSR
jgi:hypothetical protein